MFGATPYSFTNLANDQNSGETGRFEPSLSDFTCTVPCPIPNYDTNLMADDWDRRTSAQPQYQAS